MPTHKKIHSCKPHKATLKPKLAREYFFLPPKKKFFLPFLFLIKLFPHRTGSVLNPTVYASNVNLFGQSLCGLRTEPLRGESKPAGNIKLSEILKKGAVVVNQSAVLLMKCVQVQFFATQESGRNFFYFVAKNCVNSIASNPPFLKLRQALMR